MLNRLSKIRKELDKSRVDAILISSPININYLTGFSNFSREEREAYLFITKSNAILFTDSRYIEAVEKILPKNIKSTTEKPFTSRINQMVKREKVKKIGFENNLTFAEYKKINKQIDSKFALVDIVEILRTIKDDQEIKSIRKAAKLTDETYKYILPLVKLGVTEKYIAFEIEMYIKKLGGTLAFDSIVAFGPNSSVPHHHTSDKKLTIKDEFVLLDFGAKINGYCADMTRTILTKKSSAKAKQMYNATFDAQDKAAESIQSNKKDNAKKTANLANDVITKYGFESIPHGLGHGIGLEVHEMPHLSIKSNDILNEGNYFSIEPGIYIPGFGGVRIEDDYLLTKKGLEQITKSPKKLIEISI